jgi:tripartite-type tricarboxylate transporter receptor subunit TctC
MTMHGLRFVLSTLFLAVLTQPSAAQQFPSKPITMVVPYAPGGNVDVTARVCRPRSGMRSVSRS